MKDYRDDQLRALRHKRYGAALRKLSALLLALIILAAGTVLVGFAVGVSFVFLRAGFTLALVLWSLL